MILYLLIRPYLDQPPIAMAKVQKGILGVCFRESLGDSRKEVGESQRGPSLQKRGGS